MSGRKAKSLRRANPKKPGSVSARILPRKTTPMSGTWSRGLAAAGLMTGALVPLAAGTAWALPEGGTVASGSATVSNPTASSMRVDQGSDRLIMDWTRFNIAANESVRFQQPSAASIALNRVGAMPTTSSKAR